MPKRQEEEESEWMSRKENILALYVEQDEPLSKVMHVMARRGFERTWRVTKNVRQQEWDFILGQMDERKRPTNVKVRGVVIPQAKLERQRLRKRETTFDLCKSKLQPQSRSQTPPDIEISTPPAATNHDHPGLKEVAERDAHLDDVAPATGSLQQQHSHVPESSHVLSPDMSPVLLCTISDEFPPSCSETLYKYIHAAIFYASNISFQERRYLRHLHKKSVEGHFREGRNQFLQSFIKHTLPKDDLYDVVRAFDTADEMVFLRRLLVVANSAAKSPWIYFCETLLLYAAKDGNKCLVVVLLDVGVNVHTMKLPRILPHLNGLNAIRLAIHSGHKEVISILDSHGATIFTDNRFGDFDFLADAITQGTMDVARPMLTKAATADVRTARNGIEVLIHAVERSHDMMVDVLLETGFDPYSNFHKEPSPLRESAFTVALRKAKTRYLKRFLELPYHDFDSEQCQERLRQLTAGNLFARCSENFDLSNMFLGSGWDPDDIKPAMGYDYIQQYFYDMLEVAVECDDCDQVARLVKIGATANILHEYTFGTWRTKTPLLWAVKREDVFMVRQLIAVGADVNASSGYDHATALQVAVALKDLEFASLLIGVGANVNFSLEAHGKTALEIATEVGIVEMVAYFLESGADVRGR